MKNSVQAATKLTAREEIKALQEKIAALNSTIPSQTFADKLTAKVTDKGGVSVYGLGKFPVTLYASQLIRLNKLLNSTEFQEFITKNEAKLAKKAE